MNSGRERSWGSSSTGIETGQAQALTITETAATRSADDDLLIGLKHFTARELQAAPIEPPKYLVEGVIPEGTSILVSKPKVGKSCLVLNLAVAIATGEEAFGAIPVEQGRVLYAALEGATAGLKARMACMLGDDPWPEDLEILREMERLDEGGIDLLYRYVERFPGTKLIAIDTLARVRPKSGSSKMLYQQDYQAMQPVADFSRDTGVSVIVVHHTRKGESSDPVDLVSGTTGITAATDNVFVMERVVSAPHDEQRRCSIRLIAREFEEEELSFVFDSERCLWTLTNPPPLYAKTPDRQEIIELLSDFGGPMGPQEIASRTGRNHNSIRSLLWKMEKDRELVKPKHGLYALPASDDRSDNNGNNIDNHPAFQSQGEAQRLKV